MRGIGVASGLASVLLTGAIFGFFYAWVCSTMWGLDAADPRIAIAAMQSMNASVRNAVFFPTFFLTPVALFIAAVATRGRARMLFAGGGGVYLMGGLILTIAVNVPMNEALALIDVPEDIHGATAIWEAYSPRWQVFNITRTVAAGLALLLAAGGLWSLGCKAEA